VANLGHPCRSFTNELSFAYFILTLRNPSRSFDQWNRVESSASSLPLGKPMALKSPKSESEWKTLNELRELCSRRGYYLGTSCMKKKDDMVTAVLEVQLPELRVTRSAIDKNTKEAKGKLCFPCYVRSKTSEYLVWYSYWKQREIEKDVNSSCLYIYLSPCLLKIDLHLPLSHYTFSSLFHFTELSNTFSRIHPRY